YQQSVGRFTSAYVLELATIRNHPVTATPQPGDFTDDPTIRLQKQAKAHRLMYILLHIAWRKRGKFPDEYFLIRSTYEEDAIVPTGKPVPDDPVYNRLVYQCLGAF